MSQNNTASTSGALSEKSSALPNMEPPEEVKAQMNAAPASSEKGEKQKRRRMTNEEMDKELIKIKHLISKNFSVEAIRSLLGYNGTKSDIKKFDYYMAKLSNFTLKFAKDNQRTIVTADENIRDFDAEFKTNFYEVSYGKNEKDSVLVIKPLSKDEVDTFLK